VRGFHHRSSHHHGSHLAFVKATPRRYPMQAIADGFSHLVVAYIDEPFLSLFGESRERQQALPLAAARQSLGRAHSESSARASQLCASSPCRVSFRNSGKLKYIRGDLVLAETHLSGQWQNPKVGFPTFFVTKPLQNKTPKWDFPLGNRVILNRLQRTVLQYSTASNSIPIFHLGIALARLTSTLRSGDKLDLRPLQTALL
jgi:hypothetical protein